MKKEFIIYNDPEDKDNGGGEDEPEAINPPKEKEKPQKPS